MIQLACATLSAEGFHDSGFRKTFEKIPAAGFKWIECNLWFGRTMLPAAIDDLAAGCEKTGLGVAAVFGCGAGGNVQTDIDVAHKLRLMDIADRVNAKRIVFGGMPKSQNPDLAPVIETLKLIAPVAAERGLMICLENHCNFALETIEDYQKVFDAIADPCVGLCIDTGHFDAAGVPLDDVVDRLGDRVNHIHVKENRGTNGVAFTRFGEGTTDNHRVIERMIERGYSGFITVEQSPQKDRETTVEDLKTPYDMFSKYLSE